MKRSCYCNVSSILYRTSKATELTRGRKEGREISPWNSRESNSVFAWAHVGKWGLSCILLIKTKQNLMVQPFPYAGYIQLCAKYAR